MESLSSFIGVDGTNTTPNSRPYPDQSQATRAAHATASEVIRRLQPELAEDRTAHSLYAAGAGPHGGRPRQPDAVPVQRSKIADANELDSMDS